MTKYRLTYKKGMFKHLFFIVFSYKSIIINEINNKIIKYAYSKRNV